MVLLSLIAFFASSYFLLSFGAIKRAVQEKEA
jgi:hypothetical protein